ncbi:chemotaxis protein [bacterium]|nr:chemotaxis protein [bacterium]
MPNKITVAIIHGVGKQEPDFAEPTARLLKKYFSREVGSAEGLVIKPVYWEPVVQGAEDLLWKRVKEGGRIRWRKSRRYAIDYGGDALAYQPTPWDRTMYDEIHMVFAAALNALAEEAGENAPLCVISHSLGTVIASNYFYDLSQEYSRGRVILSDTMRSRIGDTPLEHGKTFSRFYTMGSPIAVWALRYGVENFGAPISISGEWVNYYDPDDIIGYPLKTLNDSYNQAVMADVAVNAGGILNFWNPSCHSYYWTRLSVIKPIAQSLARLFRAVNT